jgi:cysteinyl-tRNA synthetase
LADSALQLFNTLGGLIEPLAPADGHTLRMYACGPTVYDYGHIGNFRTFLHVDVLRRTLKQNGVAVRHAMNITDVDDKIIRNAAAAGTDIGAYTRKYEDAFFEDMDALGVERPEVLPRATENIEEMVKLIEELAAKDIAYQVEDGSWYFRIAARLRIVEGSQARRTLLADAHRMRTPRLAHRMLRHGNQVPGRELRSARRRGGPHVPAP